MKIYQLVDWMSGLNLRVCRADITLNEINDEDRVYEKLFATKNTLVVELKRFKGKEPWIIGFDLDSGKVVALPWWYFKEVKDL